MGLFFDSPWLDLVGILYVVGVASAALYWHFTSPFTYWQERGVPFLPPEPFFGNCRDVILLRKPIAEVLLKIYRGLEGHAFGGYYSASRPVLMIRDLHLVQQVIVKDFHHFHDRGYPMDEEVDPLSAHLFNLSGARWKNLRAKLSPTFTTNKMRMMYGGVCDCGEQLRNYLKRPAKFGETLEMKEIMAKFTTDVIGTCAFGLKLNSMKNPNSEFRLMGRKLFQAPSLVSKLKWWSMLFVPSLAKYLNVTLASAESREFFLKAVKETVEYREKNNVVRNDFMDLLIKLKHRGRLEREEIDEEQEAVLTGPHEEFTDNMLAAQAFVFFVAGFETSSSTMSFCLYELALNPEIQERVQEELDAARREYNGAMTYEAIQSMQYLDQVIAETLRKYPPIPNLSRVCTQSYAMPLDGVTLEAGTRVVVPVYAIHHDPKYYPSPERFDPERFGEGSKAARPSGAYMPFGAGPRMCIGMRFGLMQTKVGLAMILSNYTVSASDATRWPLQLDPSAAVTSAKGGVWLQVDTRLGP